MLEDYSALQLHSSGQWKNQGFTIIGRLQMAYDAGSWNEWYVLFSDGSNGWLAEADGAFSFLEKVPAPASTPAFSALSPGDGIEFQGKTFDISDVRTARCVGAQGELPFAVSERWTAPVADLRRGREFMTLDYSDGEPVLYRGHAVTLEQLSMQMLRSEEEIQASAGNLKGALLSLNCVGCGSTIKAAAGATVAISCTSCGRELEVEGKVTKTLSRVNATHLKLTTALRPGDSGKLSGLTWTVMGALRMGSVIDGEYYRWTEYLLYNPHKGVQWLSQSADESWALSTDMPEWPLATTEDSVSFKDVAWHFEESYTAKLERSWGSFTWKPVKGDQGEYAEFHASRSVKGFVPGTHLIRERTATEQRWTLCTPIEEGAVLKAFPAAAHRLGLAKKRHREGSEQADTRAPAAYKGHVDEFTGLELLKVGAVSHGLLFLMGPTKGGFLAALAGLAVAAGVAVAAYFEEGEVR